MDKRIYIKIKNSYESLNKTAPKGLWDKISDNLDSQGLDSSLNNKIKNSFETANNKAPQTSWENIANKLDAPEIDLNLNKKIKDSFDILNSKAPNHSWGKINRQLIIDRTWKRIHNQLNMPDIYRIMKYAAVILLLISIGFTGINYFTNDKNTLQNNQLANNTKENNSKSIDDEVIMQEHNNVISSVAENDLEETRSNGIVSFNTDKNSNSSNINLGVLTKNENTFISDTNNVKENIVVQNRNNLLAIAKIKRLDAKNVALNLKTTEIYIKPTTQNINKSDEKTKSSRFIVGDFELGFSYSYTNTLINNNETRIGLDEGSLTKISQHYENVYGIISSYSFNKKNTLSTEIYFNSRDKQDLYKYENGYLNNKQLYLNYFKISMFYQRNFLSNSSLPFNVIFGAGAYYSVLKSANETLNDITIMKNDEYCNSDYGINSRLGIRSETKRFIMEYGIKTEYGLVNVFSGNNKISAELNNTNIINYGAFVTLKIKMNKNTFRFQPLSFNNHLNTKY